MPTGLGERDVTHLRDLFAILQVPHRRGLGGDAGQPPPASGECSFSPTLPRRFPRSRSEADRVRNAGPRQGRTEGRRGGPRPAPGPQLCFLAPALPGQGCPQHVSRRAPALPWPLPPPLSLLASVPARLCRGRRPPPSPRSGQLCRTRSLPAGFCPHRRISRPASLKSRRLNLRTRPRTSLAVVAARGGTRAGRGERARLRAGLGSWKSGLELAGVREGAGSQGVWPWARLKGLAVTGPGPRRAPHPKGRGAKGRAGARWESEFQALREACPEAAARIQASPGSRTVSLDVEQFRSPQPSLGQSSSVLGGIPHH